MPRGVPRTLILGSVSVHFDEKSGRIQLRAYMRDGMGRRGFEKRPAKNEVLGAVASYLMHEAPEGSSVRVKDLGKDIWYVVSCRPTRAIRKDASHG